VGAKTFSGLLDYLQSPEAKRNSDRLRQQRVERRRERKNSEHERGTWNVEPGTELPSHVIPPLNPLTFGLSEQEHADETCREAGDVRPERDAPGRFAASRRRD
jgi:hypothetical protein